MSHAYHDALPGYDDRQILFDGCPECEQRGKNPVQALMVLDSETIRRVWFRAAEWNHDHDIGPVSEAERQLLNTVYLFEVLLQREMGLPIGTLPERVSA